MKILATCQYGWPEPYPSLNPMEEMAKRGHAVHAITGVPNYPMGERFEGYKNKVSEEDHNGIHITHVPVIPRKQDAIHRLLNYHSYPIAAKKQLMKLPGDYDVIFANQSSPVMMVEPAIAYGKKWNKRVVMYCMDLWPASLCTGGIKPDSAVYRYYWKRSKQVYRSVDVLLVTSRLFRDYLCSEFGVPENRIDYLPQYALSEFDRIPPGGEKTTTDLVFAGNVGAAQNLGVLLKAAKLLEQEGFDDKGKQIRFHIIGNGQQLENLQRIAREEKIGSVVFHGRRPAEEMPGYYAMADAMIVTMLPDPLVSLTLPAKVQSYMAAGKPILASADGEIPNVLREANCGFCAGADDPEAFAAVVRDFVSDPEREQKGQNARSYYENNFSRQRLMDKLERILEENVR